MVTGEVPGTPECEAPSLLGRVRNGEWLDAQHFPPMQWVVPGLVAEGFGLVVGPPKLGKSWFVLGLALSSACGGRALGRIPVDARPVLYAALEDGHRRMQGRARQLLAGEPIPAAFEYFTNATPAEIMPMLAEWLGSHPGGLVLLDTLGKVMPPSMPGESAYGRDYRVGGRLKALTDAHPGSALLVVHHNRKMASTDWMDSTSGTQGLNGSADYTIVLERSRGDGEALLKVSGRDVPEGEYQVTMTGGSWALVGDSLTAAASAAREARATVGLGDESARIVAAVAGFPDGVRAAELALALGMTKDSDKDKVRKYLNRACDAGRIQKGARGLFLPSTPVPSVPSVLFEDDEPDDERDNGTLGTPVPGGNCTVCGFPMVNLGDGETTHPGCGGES